MNSFDTASEAQAFMREVIDVPIASRRVTLSQDLLLRCYPQDLSEHRFTNVYDLSYRAGTLMPTICLTDNLTSVHEFVNQHSNNLASTTAGFFFLADKCSRRPRQQALNLAMSNGKIQSLPVTDREAVLCDDSGITVQKIRAVGLISINESLLSWSGSLTEYDTDCKTFGNGNIVIHHEQNTATGNIRVLSEHSRFTPKIEEADAVDMGFIGMGDGTFIENASSDTGSVDIFAHDVVVRCHKRYLNKAYKSRMQVYTLDEETVGSTLQGALSVGPMLANTDFAQHPVNRDRSLGDRPPFLDIPMARSILYQTDDDTIHIRLFDGRPGSEIFPGVTPNEVISLTQDDNIVWGCFLDPGQTAKMCVRFQGTVEAFGNRHYLKWPKDLNGQYVWVPNVGRPTASLITLQ